MFSKSHTYNTVQNVITYFGYFQKFAHTIHSCQELLVHIESLSTILLVHLKILF